MKILQRTLHLTCKQGYTLSCNLLHHLLRSTTLIYPKEYCSVPGGFNKPPSEYFPIKASIFNHFGLKNKYIGFFFKNNSEVLFLPAVYKKSHLFKKFYLFIECGYFVCVCL